MLLPEPGSAGAADPSAHAGWAVTPCDYSGPPQTWADEGHLQRDREESKDASVLAEEAQLHESPAADHQIQELRSPAGVLFSRKEVPLFHCSARHPEPLLPPPSRRWICDSTPTFLRRDNIIAHTWLPLTARLWLLERLIELYYLHQMSHRIILLKLCLTHLPIPL